MKSTQHAPHLPRSFALEFKYMRERYRLPARNCCATVANRARSWWCIYLVGGRNARDTQKCCFDRFDH